jgi:hypothetical protein
MFKLDYDAKRGGTYLCGEIELSYRILAQVFGEPAESDGYKVSGVWCFAGPDGLSFTLYDYKETSLYDRSCPSVFDFRALPSHIWHIGATRASERYVPEFKAWLLEQCKGKALLKDPPDVTLWDYLRSS